MHGATVRDHPGDDDVPPADVRERVERQFLVTVWEDLSIWRHQQYVEHPSLSPKNAKPYLSLRKWAQQFCDVPPVDVTVRAGRE